MIHRGRDRRQGCGRCGARGPLRLRGARHARAQLPAGVVAAPNRFGRLLKNHRAASTGVNMDRARVWRIDHKDSSGFTGWSNRPLSEPYLAANRQDRSLRRRHVVSCAPARTPFIFLSSFRRTWATAGIPRTLTRIHSGGRRDHAHPRARPDPRGGAALRAVVLVLTASLTPTRWAATEAGTTSCPIRPITACSSRRQNRVMVVDEDNGKLLGEVTGIKGAHGTAMARSHRARIRDIGQRPVGGDVRSEDVQGARPDSGRRGCRRDHLRPRRRTASSP